MKVLSYIAVIVFCLPASASFSQNQSEILAQTGDLAPVYRWFHPRDKDWITITENEISTTQMQQWGYQDRTFQCFVSRTPINNGVAVYRWFHPTDKDWIALRDGEIPEYQLGRWGYQDKNFQFYAWR